MRVASTRCSREQLVSNRRDRLGRLAFAEDHLREAAAGLAVDVDSSDWLPPVVKWLECHSASSTGRGVGDDPAGGEILKLRRSERRRRGQLAMHGPQRVAVDRMLAVGESDQQGEVAKPVDSPRNPP